ncbi:MAG: biopolymer transporter ExbD [bacterium]|nr:biopolymer transporter ExbD [bacterium]
MSKFRKKTKGKQEISTAALPDIVFMMLFFFMVSATIRTVDPKVQTQIPKAEELTKVQRKTLVHEIRVGVPIQSELGSQPKIAVDDHLINLDQIPQWVSNKRDEMPEIYQDQMIILLKADAEVEMGLVADIQEKLKAANARKILYRTLDEIDPS